MRDRLALERTKLANERTFLAYVRTSLSMIAGAAVLFQFFAEIRAYFAAAWVLAILGVAVLLFGLVRFHRVNRELRASVAADSDSGEAA